MDVFNISPEAVTVVALSVLGVLAAYLFLTPLLILMTLKLDAKPQAVLFDSSEKKPPRDVIQFYERTNSQLVESGFEQLSGVIMPAPLPNVRVMLWLYVHHANRDAAMVTAIWGLADVGDPLKTRYVEILSEYQQGSWEQILTNNNDEVGAFPDPPEHLISRIPQVKQIDQLYRYHQMIVRREGLRNGKVLTVLDRFDGDVTRYLQEKVLGEDYARQVKSGYLRLTQSGKHYKPTFLGTYPMTWKNLYPMKQIIQSKYMRQGKQLEAELRASG